MNKYDLEERTKLFALKIIAFSSTLPRTKAGAVIEYQLVKAGTSVGANYREATELNRDRISFIRLASLKKNPPRLVIGLNCAMPPTSETRANVGGFCRSQANFLRSLPEPEEAPNKIVRTESHNRSNRCTMKVRDSQSIIDLRTPQSDIRNPKF